VPYARSAPTPSRVWWSTYEAQWLNITLFDRAAPDLVVRKVAALDTHHPAVVEAAEFLAMRVGRSI